MPVGFVLKSSTSLLLAVLHFISSSPVVDFILKPSTSDSRTQPFIPCGMPLQAGVMQPIQTLSEMIQLDH